MFQTFGKKIEKHSDLDVSVYRRVDRYNDSLTHRLQHFFPSSIQIIDGFL